MKKVLNREQIRELERRAAAEGTGYAALMENAGRAAARVLIKKQEISGKRIAFVCGKGNNGGDGFVAARYLAERGAKATVILAEGLPTADPARQAFAALRDTTVRICLYGEEPAFASQVLVSSDAIFDAAYGVGFHGALSEQVAAIFQTVNQSRAYTIAMDLPSGVDCDTGAAAPGAVQADCTVTFSTLKPCHLLYPAKERCGEVIIAPVGIPGDLIEKQSHSLLVLDAAFCQTLFSPRRADANKGDFGGVLCFCGSYGMAGAAAMAASAALRCGAGLVHLAVPESIYPILAAKMDEPVFTVLGENAEGFSFPPEVWTRATACLVGCGLGRSTRAGTLVRRILAESRVPVILDADGINEAAEDISMLQTARAPVILTPHPGEMARLMKSTIPDIQANRPQRAAELARETGAVVVLKGAGTLIASPEGELYYNPTGNPGMARGGSGDVLAGMIAAFAAQGFPPVVAAACGAYLHGLAGDRCAARLSQTAMLPTDLLRELPALFSEFEAGR